MALTTILARHGLFTPPKEQVQSFLQHFEEDLQKGDVHCFDVLRRKLRIMSAAHGFFVDLIQQLSSCLHSRNGDMVLEALDVIQIIICKYGKNLSTFSFARLLNDVVLLHKSDYLTYTMAKATFFKMIEVNPNYTMYPLERLMAVSSEDPRLEIIGLLLEYVMSAKTLSPLVASSGCRIALEGLLFPSSATRLAGFDLLYALYCKGMPSKVLIKFFVKRNVPAKLLNAITARLQRRYKTSPIPTAVPQRYAQSDGDLIWATNVFMNSGYGISVTMDTHTPRRDRFQHNGHLCVRAGHAYSDAQ